MTQTGSDATWTVLFHDLSLQLPWLAAMVPFVIYGALASRRGAGFADDLKERSRAEAELLVREARLKSERLLQQSQDQLSRLEDEIGRCKLERDSFERQVRATVEHHLSILDARKDKRGEADSRHVLRSIGGTDAG